MRFAVFIAIAMLFGTADAGQRGKKPSKPRKHKKPEPKAPTPDPPPPPAPAEPPPAPEAASPEPAPAEAPEEPDTPARQPPPMAPKLSMRSKQAHGGFVSDMDCSACHSPAGWKLSQTAGASGFDHDRTGFALRGSHAQTQCSGCHTAEAKPTTNCDGCHRDPHQGRMDGTCAECHNAVAWADTAALEQHRRTRMPLTGRHATLDCADCHKRQGDRPWSDLPTDCYACHRSDYHAASTHPRHDGSDGGRVFPRECSLCHQTTAWNPAFADPAAVMRLAARTSTDHDPFFVLSTGSHRTAECESCHVDARRTKLVRCDSCHADTKLRAQHTAPVARSASACLRCHPRGVAR